MLKLELHSQAQKTKTAMVKLYIALTVLAALSLLGWAAKRFIFKSGEESERLDNAEEDIEVLQEQRDNDLTTVDECDSMWDDIDGK